MELQVPGLLKIRHIGQTTLGSAAVFGLFLGAGSLIHCGKSYWVHKKFFSLLLRLAYELKIWCPCKVWVEYLIIYFSGFLEVMQKCSSFCFILKFLIFYPWHALEFSLQGLSIYFWFNILFFHGETALLLQWK